MAKKALISVSDKTGIVELAKNLIEFGYEIISTGGTLKVLNESGVKAVDISSVTGFPECLDGRVKTLHPKVHAGLLAMRDNAEHMDFLKSMNIELIYSDIYPKEELEIETETISKDVYWTYNRYLLGSITHYKRSIDGIILLTTFPCGPDSLCNEMVIRKVKSVPILPIVVDELNAEAGLLTRLESFVDILNQQKGKVISHE